ncbi:cadherin domain-containing protein [Gemmata sp.]|uniref:beta strand repeat-containing protein n=1 Tax=Gemmata sp. TaxID=1914242 RepID=UPI003F6F413E
MPPPNPLLTWCRAFRNRRRVTTIRRSSPLAAEPLEPREVPATFTVTNFADGGLGSGSLRSAIISSNTSFQNQTNTINLGTGTYTLSLTGQVEDRAATGDLDITGTQTMVIQGAGASQTFIDARQIDRVFDVIGSGVTVTFKNLTITGGRLVGNPGQFDDNYIFLAGGGIQSGGANVTLDGVAVSGNEVNSGGTSAGGGISATGGSLTIQNSTISNNKAAFTTNLLAYTYSLNGANGADGVDNPFGTSTPEDGHPGGDGLPGYGSDTNHYPVSAYGGGVHSSNATVQIVNTTISSNQVAGGAGHTGGSGGIGGDGAVANLGSGGHGQGGQGGTGGTGSSGGNAGGAAVQVAGGTLTLTNVQVTSNSAIGGNGGNGGLGGDGGLSYSGAGGLGGDGGTGGAAFGAVHAQRNATVQITGTTISNNSATGGAGGQGGQGGRTGQPGTGFGYSSGGAGVGGVGGAGGSVNGAGLAVIDGTATITGATVQSNNATGGAGGVGGVGGLGHSGVYGQSIGPHGGGWAGAGGTGGAVSGVGVFLGGTVTIQDTLVQQNTGTAGAGGTGGLGGTGGNGQTNTYVFLSGYDGAKGGVGGTGGTGGAATGGGLSGGGKLTLRGTTIANNSLVAGTPGNGGNGGRGGNGGYGVVTDGNGGRGGNGGNGGVAGVVRGGGVYLNTTAGSTVANATVGFNTLTAPSVTSRGGAGGSGGSGDTNGLGGASGSDWAGTATNEGGGVYAIGTVTVANATVAFNSTGLAGGGTGVKFINTIVGSNTGTDVIPTAAAFTSAGHNLIGSRTGTTGFGGNGDLVNVTPGLVSTLALRGGKTPVFAFQSSTSLAVDAGTDPASVLGTSLTTDQRGLTRPIGSAPDIGAFESATNFVSTAYNFPASAVAGADVQGTMTVLIGDNVTGFVAQATVPSGGATLAAAGLPPGWTITPYLSGFEIQSGAPATGVYTIPLTLHTSSTAPYGSAIQLRFVDTGGLATPAVTVRYPVPTLASVNPTAANEGSATKLTVIGNGFGIGSVVMFEGIALATTYVNRTTLTATLPASVAESGPVNVTVFSPTPGGGTSNAVNFTVTNVAPTGVIPDRYVVYPGSETVSVGAGFVSAFDPSAADTAAGLRYSFARRTTALAATYATAGTSTAYSVPVSAAGTTTYYARVIDQDGGYTDYTANVFAVATNAAPTLTGANNLPAINEDNVANTGATVASLVAGKLGDADAVSGRGIAVTGLTGSHGKWQFSTDDGRTWTDFGPVSDASATLLGAADTDRVRYLPNAQDGTTATITFRGWDQTDGRTTGATGVSVSTNDGATAYSGDTATATQIVTEVNDSPVFTTLDYTMGRDGVIRIPVADVLAATPPGPAPESGQTLTLLGVRVDTFGQVPGSAVVSGGNILFRPMAGRSGYALLYFTVQDNGRTNGGIDPKQGGGLIRVLVGSTPAPGAADDTLPTVTQGSPAFVIPDSTLVLNDSPTTPRIYGGSVTLVAVGNAVGGTVELLDPPGHGARVQFTPDPTFTGVASFTYTITDDQSHTQSEATARFVVQPTNPVIDLSPPVGWTTATWADVNRDGHLDAVIGSTVYLSDGTGNFTSTFDTIGLPQLNSMRFGDYNRDGYLDVLGVTPEGEARIYVYSHSTGTFTQANFTYAAYGFTSVSHAYWADFNNDGALDVILSGYVMSNSVGVASTGFLISGSAGALTPYIGPRVLITSASFADADGDGDLDLLASTSNGPQYFQNSGGFFSTSVNPTNNTNGTISAWGDYDGDGLPDFVASGFNALVGPEFGLYRNSGGGTFTFTGLIEASQQNESAMQWADVDSDGDLDFIYSRNGGLFIQVNDGGLFGQATATDVPVRSQINPGAIAWGDFNGNGTLDVLQPASSTLVPTVVENYGAAPTSRPTAPTDLTVTAPATGNTVRLGWDGASDDNTPAPALTYTVRIGTTPGGNDVVSAPALADGTRLVAAPGAYSRPFADVTLVGGRMYYWEVQAVDATLRGSVFTSGSFYFNHVPRLGGGVAITTEDTPLALTAANFLSSVSDADPGDTVQSIRIDALPSNGTLLYQGSAVAVGQMIPVSGPDYDAADWLVYAPAPNYATYGPAERETIRYAVSDGHDFSDTGDLDIVVQPVTDAPYLTVSDVTVPAGVPGAFPISAGSADDDGSEDVHIDILNPPPGVTFSAGALDVNVWRLTPADLADLQIVVASPVPTTFELTVHVYTVDPGSFPPQSIQKTITVTTQAPTIDTISVPATGVEGTAITLTASASDPSTAGLTYTWQVFTPNGVIELDGASASFTPLDNGPSPVVLTVTDGLGAVAHSQPRHIHIDNVNPVIASVANNGPVGEGSPVTITVDASDAAGVYDPLAYFFDYDNDGAYESMDPTHVFPAAGEYTVGVRVVDGDGGEAEGTTTVTVTHANPTDPTDSDAGVNTVAEGAVTGTAVGVTAAAAQLNGLAITYSLTDGAGGRFAIDAGSGVVTVADASRLDFETAASHTITVQASDGKGGTSTADFVIAVTNAAPGAVTDANSAPDTVTEGAAVGTAVGVTASATDVNGPVVTYTLTDSAGSPFAIDPATGVVTVANPALLDYETATAHTITVQASDGHGGVSTETFTIAVTNVSPGAVTDADDTTNTVPEGAAAGTAVGVTATALDVNGPAVTYSLTDDADGRFAIDAGSGAVTVANASRLNFETAASHTITVQASDGKGGASSQTFTVGVTNVDPGAVTDADATTNVVSAGAATGTRAGVAATATDVNGPSVTYTLTDDADGRFAIDAATGVVSVADGSHLDPGTATSHTITVQASDGKGGTSTQTFAVAVASRPLDFDFQPTPASPVQPGAVAVAPGAAYTPAAGFGWVAAPGGFDSGALAVLAGSPLAAELRDGALGTAGPAGAATFRIDLGSAAPVHLATFLGNGLSAYAGVEVAYSTDGVTFAPLTPDTGAAVPAGAFVPVSSATRVSAGITPGRSAGVYAVWVRFQGPAGWAATGVSARAAAAVGTLSVAGPGGAPASDGTSVDTFRVTGAAPGAVLTVTTTLGTVATDARPELVGTQVVADATGAAEVRVRRPSAAGTATVAAADVTGAAVGSTAQEYGPPPRRFDMKANSTGKQSAGWDRVMPGTKYSAATGYGWATTGNVGGSTGGRVPAGGDAAVLGDYAYGLTPVAFKVFVGAGVSATVAVHTYAAPTQGLQGVRAAVAGAGGTTQTLRGNGTVTVSGTAGADGVLTVTFSVAPGSSLWIVNAIEVTRTGR